MFCLWREEESADQESYCSDSSSQQTEWHLSKCMSVVVAAASSGSDQSSIGVEAAVRAQYTSRQYSGYYDYRIQTCLFCDWQYDRQCDDVHTPVSTSDEFCES